VIVRKGDPGPEMFLICRGQVEVLSDSGGVIATLKEGDIFGELAVLLGEKRTATVRAKTPCDLFVLEKNDFNRILREHEHFAQAIRAIAQQRFEKVVAADQPK
jgi:CRP-like cAMP-binding protein